MKNVKHSILISYIYIFINIFTGLIYTPWMIKQIGSSEYALYGLSLSLITMFTVDFGLSNSVSRFLLKIKNEQSNEESTFCGIVFKAYLLIDLVIFICLFVLYFFIGDIYKQLTVEEIEKFKVIYIITLCYTVCSFPFQSLPGVFVAKERFYISKIIDLLNKLLTVITTIFVLMLGYKIYALVLVNVSISILALIIKLIYIAKNHLLSINLKAKDNKLLKETMSFSIWNSVSSTMARLLYNATPSVLASLSGSFSVTIFTFASSLEGYVSYFAMAMTDVFLPNVSKIIDDDDKDKLVDLMVKVGRIQMKVIGIIVLGFLVVGKEFITCWIGSQYVQVYYVTIGLILPYFVTSTEEIAHNAIAIKGYVKEKAYCYMAAIVIFGVLLCLLTPKYDVMGASIAIYICLIVETILLNILLYRKLNINIVSFMKRCYVPSFLTFIVILVTTALLFTFMPSYISWKTFLIKGIVFVLDYLIIMYFIGCNKEEKMLFKNTAVKIVNKILRKN